MRCYYPKKNKNIPNGAWYSEQDLLPLRKKVEKVKNTINKTRQ